MIDPKIKALELKYKAGIAEQIAEIQNYLDNPVGVGEHGSLVDTMDTLVGKLAESAEKLDMLERYFYEDL